MMDPAQQVPKIAAKYRLLWRYGYDEDYYFENLPKKVQKRGNTLWV